MIQRSSPVLLKTRRFADDRGWFMETYSESGCAKQGIHDRFVQDNHSRSVFEGTIRGIHFQKPPYAQAKLVRCVKGAIIDYAVDLRAGSPTYGKWLSAELSAENDFQLYVPVGYGHAFVTTQPDSEVVYKVSDVYAQDCEGGVIWNDAALGIDWKLPASGPVLSQKDAILSTLAEFESPFAYDGNPMEPLATS